MFKKLKKKAETTAKEIASNISEETKEKVKTNAPLILSGATLAIVFYMAIKMNNKPITIIINNLK